MLNVSIAIEKFIKYKKSMACAKDTIIYYKRNLDIFHLYFGERDVSEISDETFLEFQHWVLQNYSIKKVSVQTYARAVKTFFRWLDSQKIIKIDLSKIELIKAEKTMVYPLTNDELITVINYFNENDELELRNKIIIMLMADCGLRRGEIPRLKKADVNYANRTLVVNGKGGKVRLVPFGVNFQCFLNRYLSLTEDNKNEFIFITNDGRPITENTIKMFVTKLKKNTGIQRIHPHLLRHTYATNFLLDGGDIETLRILMGHEDITTTQKYVHIAAQMRILNSSRMTHIDRLLSSETFDFYSA